MARTKILKRKELHNQRVQTTMIRATERMAVKIRDNYYTLELTEERSIPNNPNIDLEEEKSRLFESVKTSLYKEVEELVDGLR